MFDSKKYHREYIQKWRLTHPEKRRTNGEHRKSMLKTTHNLSLEEYNILFSLQSGLCAVCKRHQSAFKRSFAVDHDHATGKIRGLLCFGCNISLGHLQDNLQWLQNAIDYIKRGAR